MEPEKPGLPETVKSKVAGLVDERVPEEADCDG
jgi:hypothetical protein